MTLIRWAGGIVGVGLGLLLGVLIPGAQWLWLVPLCAVIGAWGLPRLASRSH
jgi:hypothetical protein